MNEIYQKQLSSRMHTWTRSKCKLNDSNELKRSQSMCTLRSFPNKFNVDVNEAHPQMNGKNVSNDSFIGQIERNALHSNVHRYAISSLNGTKNFVLNPLFDENGTDC